jgi:hypothetical protein
VSTITDDISRLKAQLPVDSDPGTALVMIDAELIHVRSRGSETQAVPSSAPTTLLVDRGYGGTAAVAHLSGASVTPAYPAVSGSAGDTRIAKIITAAGASVERMVQGSITITPASAFAMSPATDSLAGVRGDVTLTSGKSITAGFLFGTQGKAILDGATVAVGSGHVAGVYGQMSAAGATLTSGHIAPIISCGQSLPAGIADMIYCENNDVTKLHAILEAVANADFVVDATSEDGNSAYLVGTAGASASKYMRVKLSGTEYRIALLAAS